MKYIKLYEQFRNIPPSDEHDSGGQNTTPVAEFNRNYTVSSYLAPALLDNYSPDEDPLLPEELARVNKFKKTLPQGYFTIPVNPVEGYFNCAITGQYTLCTKLAHFMY